MRHNHVDGRDEPGHGAAWSCCERPALLPPADLRFSVAPMLDWTDRHCRVFHRLMSRRARLYTEMVTTGAIIHGDRDRLLGFDAAEHPVAVQLGGSSPDATKKVAKH